MGKGDVYITKKEFFTMLTKLSSLKLVIYTDYCEIGGLTYGFVRLQYSGSKSGTTVLRTLYVKNTNNFWRKDYNLIDRTEQLENWCMKYKSWMSDYRDIINGNNKEENND